MIADIKHKIRQFVVRYHLNQMLRGAILSLAGLLAVWLGIILAENFGYFSSLIRKVLFFAYILFAAVILYKNVLLSLLKIYGVSKPLSDLQAARYIGKYLPGISDKLTNLLQLSENQTDNVDNQFIQKAIEQKSNELSPFDFKTVIKFNVNRKYLKYLVPPALVFLVLLLSAPTIITEPSRRLTSFNTEYEKPQPFYVDILNDDLKFVEGEDVILDIKTRGEQIPDKLYFQSGKERVKLRNIANGRFEHQIQNIRKEKKFIITDGIVESETYAISVLKKPEILGYEIELDYPKYLGKENKTTENQGDLIVPYGTSIKWYFKALNADHINVSIEDEVINVNSSNQWTMERTAKTGFQYHLTGVNEHVVNRDTLSFSVAVIPDQYPEIDMSLVDDTSSAERAFFNGVILDDYGFSKMNFSWKKKDENQYRKIPISIEQDANRQAFYFSFRKDTVLKPGDVVEYYFEVWDNDGVRGPKSTRSATMTIEEPSKEEIEEKIEKESRNFKNSARETSKQIQQMNKEFEDLRKRLINKDQLDWEDKESIRKILDKSEELKEKIEELEENLENQSREEQKLKEKQEDILEKEQKLKELMDKLLDEDLLKKIEELRKMLEKDDKNELQKNLQEMNMDNLDLEKELERSLELFKRLEVEKDMQDAIEDLRELEKEQEKAMDEGKDKGLEKQEEINRDFENVREKLKDAREKDAELEDPMNIEDTKEQEEEIEENLQKAGEQLKEGKGRKGKQQQQEAKQKMKKLADDLESMMAEMMQQSSGEDLRMIRELLENTVKTSVNQEKLMEEFKNTSKDDPQFVELIQQQKNLREDLAKIQDSLYALSKRQIMIQSFINKEMSDIDRNMAKAMESMLALNTIGYTRSRDKDEAMKRQQYVMKSLNNIALMLAESMDQMKEQMRKQGKKQGSCKNPKPGEKGKPSLQQMQQQLNESLKQMQKEMKQGKKSGSDGKSMNEKLARSAAKQREIRKKLEELRKEMQSKGNPANKSIGETLREMEQTEEELVNKMLNENMLKRQQEILTRLLEHENARREQEYEKKRESEEAKDDQKSNPDEFLEYKRLKEKDTELLRMVPPELAPFYRSKLNEYYINLGRENGE